MTFVAVRLCFDDTGVLVGGSGRVPGGVVCVHVTIGGCPGR